MAKPPPLRHLITLADLSAEQIIDLLDTAESLRATALRPVNKLPLLRGRTVVNLFFEPSTRTRTSFELAAKRLSADVINFDVAHSSTSKGETLLDTLRNLEAMRCDLFVVRHQQNGTPAYLAEHAAPGVVIVNAGDGNHAHPTQGLLDMFTIRRHKADFSQLTITIVGDILHSRVARSDIHALRALGVGELRIAGPASLLPEDAAELGCRIYHRIEDALANSDVIIMLRLQKERMQHGLIASDQDYARCWGLDRQRLQLARADAIVMHPGPINRGVEISDEVADGAQSVILQQVSNGIAVRMAVMAKLLGQV
ncbi:MAG: aspartate carbamoyltransferase catalytic subunit [Lysobacterales bacterium CG02_land_8_20_14_3_00_62_12]|nr:MAG: aspartate carbamoyltransferase catalytic subunit [Xanthomonadales bacterium CG02_land_8_20_14_3_00_62_12]